MSWVCWCQSDLFVACRATISHLPPMFPHTSVNRQSMEPRPLVGGARWRRHYLCGRAATVSRALGNVAP